MTNIYRFSFSVLYPWSNGQYEEALARYFRTTTIETPQMREGKLLHDQWRQETEKTKKLPSVFGELDLQKPECEVKMECLIDDWIQFVGVVDLLEEHRITDYKTGGSNSLAYISTPQLRCYQLLCIENGYVPTEGFIRHFNQYTNEVTTSKMYFSDYTRELGRDWILTYASEMRDAIDKVNRVDTLITTLYKGGKVRIYDKVKEILEQNPQTRNSDKELMWQVWFDMHYLVGNMLSYNDFRRAPTPESITRARRKVQEHFPHLQATTSVRRERQKKQATKGTFAYREELPKGQTKLV